MTKETLLSILYENANMSFARSGGPGGQNVNKVNTKVHITFDLNLLEEYSPITIQRIKNTFPQRINTKGEMFLQIQEERSQIQNRQIGLNRMAEMIQEAAKPPKIRKKTKPSRASQRRRVEGKKMLSEKKKHRRAVSHDDHA